MSFQKWCPKGCGKSVERDFTGRSPLSKVRFDKLYKCYRCKKAYDLKELKAFWK